MFFAHVVMRSPPGIDALISSACSRRRLAADMERGVTLPAGVMSIQSVRSSIGRSARSPSRRSTANGRFASVASSVSSPKPWTSNQRCSFPPSPVGYPSLAMVTTWNSANSAAIARKTPSVALARSAMSSVIDVGTYMTNCSGGGRRANPSGSGRSPRPNPSTFRPAGSQSTDRRSAWSSASRKAAKDGSASRMNRPAGTNRASPCGCPKVNRSWSSATSPSRIIEATARSISPH